MSTKETLRIAFRVFPHEKGKNPQNDVIAIFPDIKDGNGNMASYMHVGQHGDCDPALLNELRPATPSEYEPLKNELAQIYSEYELNVI